MLDHGSVNVAKHGVGMEGAQPSAIHLIKRALQSGRDHRLGGVAMCRANALAETVVEGIVEVEDYAADQRTAGRRVSLLRLLALS